MHKTRIDAEMRVWLIVSIVLLGFALRIIHIDHFSLWLDEGLTPLRAGYSLPKILANEIDIQGFTTKDTHPPLYYLLIHYLRPLIGGGDFGLRLPSALFGVLSLPLLWQLGRALFGRLVALIALLLFTVNPMQIWYAQEARMYTLLILLLLAASYQLWQAYRIRLQSRRLLLYGLFAMLAVYTHYTAIFVVTAQLLLWGVVLWRHGWRRAIVAGLSLLALATLPLLPIVVPRLLSGPETSYFAVPPTVVIFDIVRGFGLGRTVPFDSGLIQLLLVPLALLPLLGWVAARTPARLFLAIYLLATVAGLIVGSLLFKPMYLGPHHILAGSPAFYLLLARGVGVARRPLLVALLALLPLTAELLSLNNLYFDHAYAKEDYRSLVAYIERSAGADDVVLYNNAILLPLHQHYQQRADLPLTALPVYPTMADETTAAAAAALLQAHERVWYVPEHPRDGRDDAGVVAAVLQRQAETVDGRGFHGRFAEVNVDAYRRNLRPASLPATAQALDSDAIAGYSLELPPASPTLWLRLFQRADGGELRVQLRDRNATVWAEKAQAAAAQPDGRLAVSDVALPLPLGTPPGEYQLWLHDGDGWLPLTTVALDADWEQPPQAPLLTFANGLQLVALEMPPATTPGNPLPLTLYWRATRPLDGDWQYEVDVVGAEGLLRSDRQAVGVDWLPASQFPVNRIVAQPSGIYPRPDAPTGEYRLHWRLINGDAATGVRPWWRPWFGAQASAGRFQVAPWPFVAALPAAAAAAAANDFGDMAQLAAYEIDSAQVTAGATLPLTLYWRAQAQPQPGWQIFVHLSALADAPPLAQSNGVPAAGQRPTGGWRSGEVIADPHLLTLPADLPPARYTLYVGFYDPQSGSRLPVFAAGQPQPHQQLQLTTIDVP